MGGGFQRRLVVGAACLATLALVGPATAASSAVIVPGRAIGPIAIGDERATIAARFGDGVVASRTPDPAHPGNRQPRPGERPLPGPVARGRLPHRRGEQRRRPPGDPQQPVSDGPRRRRRIDEGRRPAGPARPRSATRAPAGWAGRCPGGSSPASSSAEDRVVRGRPSARARGVSGGVAAVEPESPARGVGRSARSAAIGTAITVVEVRFKR